MAPVYTKFIRLKVMNMNAMHNSYPPAQGFFNMQFNIMCNSNGICAAVKACLCSEEMWIIIILYHVKARILNS